MCFFQKNQHPWILSDCVDQVFFFSGYHGNSIGKMHYFSRLQVVFTAEGSNFLSYSQIHCDTFYGNLDFGFTFL